MMGTFFGMTLIIMLWVGALCIGAYFERTSSKGFDEWLNSYEMKELLTKQTETGNYSYGGYGIGGDSAYCYITNKFIGADILDMEDHGGCRFTHEFNAWVSQKGQQILEEANCNKDLSNEWQIIWDEWNDSNQDIKTD